VISALSNENENGKIKACGALLIPLNKKAPFTGAFDY